MASDALDWRQLDPRVERGENSLGQMTTVSGPGSGSAESSASAMNGKQSINIAGLLPGEKLYRQAKFCGKGSARTRQMPRA